jgi:hypothetical protein
MRESTLRLVVMTTLLVAMSGRGAAAQTACDAVSPAPDNPTCGRISVTTASVPHILRLELSTLNTPMAPPDVEQFDSTRVASTPDQLPLTTGPVVTVKANRPWRLTVEAVEPTFTFTPDPLYQLGHPTGKPASDLTWSVTQGTGFRPLDAASPQEVASSATRGSYAQYTMYYRTRWRYDVDVPGTYALSVSYTIIGQ